MGFLRVDQPWLPGKKLNDIGAVEVAYTFVRKVCAHSSEVNRGDAVGFREFP
jgi:hypothetical protein